MTNDEFTNVYFPRYEGVIRAIARKLAYRNDALMEDLYSEGTIALWKVNPKKAKDNPDAYIRQAIKFRMIDRIRKERPGQMESLDLLLDHGHQVVYDEDAETPILLMQPLPGAPGTSTEEAHRADRPGRTRADEPWAETDDEDA